MYGKITKIAAATALCLVGVEAAAQDDPTSPALGKVISSADLDGLSTIVYPDGEGLPQGSGTVAAGAVLYEEQCSVCHAENGRGDMSVGVPGVSGKPQYGSDWSTGSSWPYATSIFDFVRRGMPPYAPGELSADDVYSLTAYILHMNELLDENGELNQETLQQVVMPALSYHTSKWETEQGKQ